MGLGKVRPSKGYLFKVRRLCCWSMSFHRNRIFNAIYAYRQFGSISYLLFRKTKKHKTLNNKRKNAFSNAFTNSLERKKHAFVLRVRWLLISELYCIIRILCAYFGSLISELHYTECTLAEISENHQTSSVTDAIFICWG